MATDASDALLLWLPFCSDDAWGRDRVSGAVVGSVVGKSHEGGAKAVQHRYAKGYDDECCFVLSTPISVPDSGWTISCRFLAPLPTSPNKKVLALAKSSDAKTGFVLFTMWAEVAVYDKERQCLVGTECAWQNLAPAEHHIVACAQNATTTFFMDGAVVGEVGYMPVGDVGRINGDWEARNPQGFGKIRDFKLFSRALTKAEIDTLCGSAG